MGLRANKLAIMFLVLFFNGSIATKGDAAWNGPTEILSGGWGSEVGQFGINYGDSSDQIPDMIVISSSGKILIGDSINKRIQVFNADGKFSNLIIPKGFPTSYPAVIQWPLSLSICGDSSLYTERNEYLQIYGINGELQQNFTNVRGGIAFIDQQCNFYTYDPSRKLYSYYSSTGQLIQTYTARPPELGAVSQKTLSSTTAKITIQYPDKTWSYTDVGRMSSYLRDTSGNLYGYGDTQVIRYTTCGREAAMLMMPKKIIQETSRGPQIDPQVTVLEEYGSPVIAPNGDVYTWKRTPTAYSILKWTWVDDPNAPANAPDTPGGFSLKTTSTGINLFWQAVPQDPGCLTGYELARSTTSGGPYSTLATVNAGTADARGLVKYSDTTASAGTTYYYKVRAAAGTEYSPYTAEALGKR